MFPQNGFMSESLKIVNDKSEKKKDEERARLSVELSMVARVL